MNRAGRLGVGIIGAGKVGPVIAAALAGAGHALTGITAGTDAERIEAMLPGLPVLDALEVVRRSELVVVSVPHDELRELVSGLAEIGAWQPGQLVLHTDPAYGTDVLSPVVSRGAIPLAVHPAIAFTGTSIDLRQLAQAYAAVTAPAAVLPIAQALAVELGCEPVVIAEGDRQAYAEGIAIVTHFSRSIVAQAADLLRGAGVPHPGSYLSALVHSTVDHALAEAGSAGAGTPADTIAGCRAGTELQHRRGDSPGPTHESSRSQPGFSSSSGSCCLRAPRPSCLPACPTTSRRTGRTSSTSAITGRCPCSATPASATRASRRPSST